MSYLSKLHDITTFVFDVDGVLSDGMLHITEEGQLLRNMNTRDGFAIKHALKAGYRVIIITGGRSQGVVKRLEGLGVKEIHSGIQQKIDTLNELVEFFDLDLGKTLYMGDDLPDYDCMRVVHLATCPADAAQEIQRISHFVSALNGGQGCVRDVIERVLKVQGQWTFGVDA